MRVCGAGWLAAPPQTWRHLAACHPHRTAPPTCRTGPPTRARHPHLPRQVVAVGEGREDEETKQVVKPNVALGATVLYSKYSGTEFEVGRGRPV